MTVTTTKTAGGQRPPGIISAIRNLNTYYCISLCLQSCLEDLIVCTDPGRHPCETNTLHLRDFDQKDHLVLADMGCRNTVFNAQAQSGATFVSQLQMSGFKSFRIELVDEPAHQVKPLLEGYHNLLNGKMTARDLWSELQFVPDANGNAQGVSSGSLRPGSEHGRDKSTMKKTAAQIDPKWAKGAK